MRFRFLFSFGMFLIGLLTMAGSPAAWGQAATSLRGSVTDPSGAGIPNATIHLINTGTNAERTAASDAQGEYIFLQVVPGPYRLEVDATGFSKYLQTGIQLQVNSPATVNVKLKLGPQQQTVTVNEAAPIINNTDASEGTTMGEMQLEQLPIEARDIVQLLSLEPGVVYTSDRSDMDSTNDTRSGAVNGERSDQSNVSLDGVDDNQQTSGQAFSSVLPVPIESVQEFRVTTSNYGADQGRSSGAQVALVTKGGTNTYHGALYDFNRSGIGEANDYFIKQSELADNEPNTPLHLVRNVFGAALGGPIKKDRLFVYLNYEGYRQSQADSAERTVPSMSLRDGVIMYYCDQGGTGAPLDSRCNNPSPVMGKSGQSYNVPADYYALGYTASTGSGLQSQIASIDPLGIGPSSLALAYFNTYPTPNDPTAGDGVNYIGYRFAAASTENFEWLVGRVDYKITANGNHTLFWRGSGRNDITHGDPFLPGTPPESTTLDRSKGFVLGYTALLRSNLVNNFHYGLTRQSISNQGNSNQPWVYIRGLDQGITYSNDFTLPVHNLVDDLTWTKGTHSLNFGADVRLIRNTSGNQNLSYSYATMNSEWLDVGGFAGKPSAFNPACLASFNNSGNCLSTDTFPAVDGSFDTSYDFPLIGMLGMVTEDNAQYNYHLNPDGTGTALNQGAPVVRHFSTDEFDFYLQDSWKIRPNLTFNYGLRYELMTPVAETSGQEVMPNLPLGAWFNQRAVNGEQGIPSNVSPNISFDLAGPAYGKSGYYGAQTKNFAPRISIAWSPQPGEGFLHKLFGDAGKSVIRAGAGMYYDHFGYELVQSFDQNGAFGLATNLGNPAQVESATSSPRLATNFNTIPGTDNNGVLIYLNAPAAKFPEQFPLGNFCICWGIDNNLKTPYSYALDLSYERELTRSMSLEVAYVGHLAHRLLAQDDLASPMNLVDPKSKITYFQAASALAKIYSVPTPPATSTITAASVGPTAAYWTDMVQGLQPGGSYGLICSGGGTQSVIQAIYDMYSCYAGNETSALDYLDQYGIPDANLSTSYFTNGGPFSYFQNQFSSLYAWRTMTNAAYNGLQVTLKQEFSHGLQFDFNYTYSKSIDIASDAERVGPYGGLGGSIINAWDPSQGKAVSDFDLRHQLNANWVWQLPFGRGRAFGHEMGRGLDALVGGWQLSGVARWSSGFPVTVDNGGFYPTDWQLEGHAALTGPPIPTGKAVVDGYLNMFTDPGAAFAAMRHAYPGETGARNVIRGDGYAGLDLGLDKTWKMPYNDNHSLEFSWNVFNVPNLTRFNVQTASLAIDTASTFGRYTNLLTNPRIMQFGLRYAF